MVVGLDVWCSLVNVRVMVGVGAVATVGSTVAVGAHGLEVKVPVGVMVGKGAATFMKACNASSPRGV